MECIDKLKGHIIDGQFKITQKLSEGAFGNIYEAKDLKNMVQQVMKPVIIKFTRNHKMNDSEYDSLKDII